MKNNTIDIFWPEYKVYLYGQVVFLRKHIEGVGFYRQKLSRYFQFIDSEDKLESELGYYEKAGYFKVSIGTDGDGRELLFLNNINEQKFKTELIEYISKIRHLLDQDQIDKIWDSATKQKNDRGFSPKISWRDIYGDTSRYNYHPPFWEYILNLAHQAMIILDNMEYTGTVPYLIKENGLAPMPKEMLDYYVRPFAEVTIIDSMLKKIISKPNSKSLTRVTLNLVGNNLWGHIGEKRYLLWHYQSKKSNNYLALESLINQPGVFLSRESLNLKPNTKTSLKHFPSNMGLSGVINELFLQMRDRPKQSLKLVKTILVERAELELLKSEFENRDTKNR